MKGALANNIALLPNAYKLFALAVCATELFTGLLIVEYRRTAGG